MIGYLALLPLVAVLALALYVRLSPSDPARWHIDPAQLVPEEAGWRSWVLYPPGPTDGVIAMESGAYAAVFLPGRAPSEVLERLSKIAEAAPGTLRLAGSVDEGLVTWETRSRLWGFPDLTTTRAEWRISDGSTFSMGDGTMLFIVARQRFGRRDWGVNAARLRDWLSQL